MSPIASGLALMTVVTTAAICVAAVLSPLARGRASLRHLFWHGALVMSVVGAMAVASPVRRSIVLPILRAHASQPTSPDTRAASTGAPATSGRDPATMVLLLWLVGSLSVVGRYTRALSRAAALRRRASSVGSMRWERDLAAACARIGYRGRLEILVSREIDVPVVMGLHRPAILLPAAASEWPERDTRLACLHEVAHVERGDHLARALGTLALALHWFNPLMWWLTARAAADSELAADEVVLSTGVCSTDYAEMLVSIAERTVWRPAIIPGVALVGRPLLTTRVHAILAGSRRRSSIGRRPRRVTVAAAAIVAATLGTVHVQLVAAHEESPTALAPIPVVATVDRPLMGPPPPWGQSRATSDRAARAAGRRATRTDRSAEPAGVWTARAVAALMEVLDDPSPQVRAAAARSLSQLGGAASRRALERALTDSSAFVQDEARRALDRVALSRGGD